MAGLEGIDSSIEGQLRGVEGLENLAANLHREEVRELVYVLLKSASGRFGGLSGPDEAVEALRTQTGPLSAARFLAQADDALGGQAFFAEGGLPGSASVAQEVLRRIGRTGANVPALQRHLDETLPGGSGALEMPAAPAERAREDGSLCQLELPSTRMGRHVSCVIGDDGLAHFQLNESFPGTIETGERDPRTMNFETQAQRALAASVTSMDGTPQAQARALTDIMETPVAVGPDGSSLFAVDMEADPSQTTLRPLNPNAGFTEAPAQSTYEFIIENPGAAVGVVAGVAAGMVTAPGWLTGAAIVGGLAAIGAGADYLLNKAGYNRGYTADDPDDVIVENMTELLSLPAAEITSFLAVEAIKLPLKRLGLGRSIDRALDRIDKTGAPRTATREADKVLNGLLKTPLGTLINNPEQAESFLTLVASRNDFAGAIRRPRDKNKAQSNALKMIETLDKRLASMQGRISTMGAEELQAFADLSEARALLRTQVDGKDYTAYANRGKVADRHESISGAVIAIDHRVQRGEDPETRRALDASLNRIREAFGERPPQLKISQVAHVTGILRKRHGGDAEERPQRERPARERQGAPRREEARADDDRQTQAEEGGGPQRAEPTRTDGEGPAVDEWGRPLPDADTGSATGVSSGPDASPITERPRVVVGTPTDGI